MALNDNLTKTIEKNYQIGPIKSLKKNHRGFLSDSFVIETKKDKYLLKQYNINKNPKQQQVDFIEKSTLFFAKHNIPAITPLKNIFSKYYFVYNDNYYAIFPYINAKTYETSNLSDVAIVSLGKMLAKIHLAGRSGYPKYIGRTTKDWAKSKFLIEKRKILAVLNKKEVKTKVDHLFLEEMKIKEKLVNKYNINFKDLGLKSDHLTHGDYHARNVFFDKNDEVKYVFDFKSRISPRELDLGRSIELIFFSKKINKKSFSSAGKFIDSYIKYYPMKKQQIINGIKGTIIKHYYVLWKQREYYLNNNKTVVKLLKNSLDRLKYVSRDLDGFIEKITSNLN